MPLHAIVRIRALLAALRAAHELLIAEFCFSLQYGQCTL